MKHVITAGFIVLSLGSGFALAAQQTTTEKAGEATKDAGKATADGAKKAGKATAEGTKKAGKATADGAETAGKATADGAKTAGKATANATDKSAKSVKKAVTGDGHATCADGTKQAGATEDAAAAACKDHGGVAKK
jgi:hypothetical protein